jgi:hypothetical protein
MAQRRSLRDPGIDPFACLRDLLAELPKIDYPTDTQLDFWLPDAWASRLAADSKQA